MASDSASMAARQALAESVRQAYLRQPESVDDGWEAAEAWDDT